MNLSTIQQNINERVWTKEGESKNVANCSIEPTNDKFLHKEQNNINYNNY